MSDLISIIIPTFNRAQLLSETLESISKQTHTAWECIVVDDGSTDATWQLLKTISGGDPRVKIFKRPSHIPSGGNGARNFGYQQATGNYIQWFDSDDVMHPHLLAKQLEAIQKTKAAFSVCHHAVFDTSVEQLTPKTHLWITSKNPFTDFIQLKVLFTTGVVLFSKTVIEAQDALFDTQLKAAQEWEFFVRILSTHHNYTTVAMLLVFKREHADNISANKEGMVDWHYFLARRKVYDNPNISLTDATQRYLRLFMFKQFKKMTRKKNTTHAFRAFHQFIWPSSHFSLGSKIAAFCAILSFKLLGKGTYFINRMTLK